MTGDVRTPTGGLFVVGYVLEQRATDLKYTRQPQKINEFCKKQGYSLIFTEQEIGMQRDMCRSGLWRVTRALVCYHCDAGMMPVSYEVEDWVRRAMMPCRCAEPSGVMGIVVSGMSTICSEPVGGSKYALALAMARKHLFVVEGDRCVSCCNPAARPFMSV